MCGALPKLGSRPASGSLGGLGVDDLGRAVADRNLARLQRLGDLAHEIDVKQAVLEARALDLDVVGELEAALERPRGNALVEHFAGLLGLRLLLAADRQGVFLGLDREVGLGEPGDRKRDAIGVLAGPLDVVGRIARRAVDARDLVEQGKQPVETDGRTIEGSKIECAHGMTSLVERHAVWSTVKSDRSRAAHRARTDLMWVASFAASRDAPRRPVRALSPRAGLLQGPASRPARPNPSPPMTLISTPANPVPEGAVTGVLKTPDGAALRFARWAPPSGRKGTLLVLPGRTEFIEKYFEVVSEARARGFAVGMIDWRGQGLSERALRDPLKGHVGNFGEYDLDLETFVREIVLPDCPPPLFALGHSMGAAMLLRAAQKGRRWFDRVVLCAPMIALAGRAGTGFASVTARTLRLVGLGGSYVPGGGAKPVAALPFIGNVLTSDPVRYARTAAIVEAEPMLGLGSPTGAPPAAGAGPGPSPGLGSPGAPGLDAPYRARGHFPAPKYREPIPQPILI